GGGGSGGSGIDLSTGNGSFGDLVGEERRLSGIQPSLAPEDPSNRSDTAQFDGIILLVDDLPAAAPGDTAYIGQVRFDANFATGDMQNGRAFNFFQNVIDSSNNPAGPANSRAGELTLTADNFSSTGTSAFNVDMNGTFDLDGSGAVGASATDASGRFNGVNGSNNPTVFSAEGISVANGGAGGELVVGGSTTLDWSILAD
ncbi:MAG: hypothetical protein AAF762_15390, partial [Pseudomonadota bacterium]